MIVQTAVRDWLQLYPRGYSCFEMMISHIETTPGEVFGLGGYVVLNVARSGRLGSVGQFGWFGAASTYYTIDRREQLIAILLMQHLPQDLPQDPPKISDRFYNLVYQSLLPQ